jgi:succinylglutamic semialdehyde dehydrogenase
MISYNPYDHTELGGVECATAASLKEAFVAAKSAQKGWWKLGFEARADILRNYGDTLSAERDSLAQLIAEEAGKPLWESRTEVDAMAKKIDISIAAHTQRCGDFAQGIGRTSFRPLGVVAVLGPFNFPGHLPNGHMVPALLAGNGVLFKPSEQTPLVGQRMVELMHAAGIPEALVQVVQGGGEVGQAICELPDLKGLFFTGSSRVGLAIHRHFAGRPETLLALEMGGNNPLMVDGVADLAAASKIICQSAFVSAGQRCTCARRLVIPQGREGDALIEQILADMATIRVGNPLGEPQPYIGTLISSAAAEQGLAFQDSLQAKGGRILRAMEGVEESAAILTPGLIDVSDVADLHDRECFAPLLQVQRYDSIEEGYAICNDTAYGLAAGLLSDSAASFERFAVAVSVGILNWNAPLTGASSASPFGGTGQSGNHRPSAYLAADYCSYPVASIENAALTAPASPPGFGKEST